MKHITISVLFLTLFALSSSQADPAAEALRWSISGDLGIGYAQLYDTDFFRVAQAGLGTVQEQGPLAAFTLGGGGLLKETLLLGLAASYSTGGISWDQALGRDYSIPLYHNKLDLRVELQLVPRLFAGFFPFIGAGYNAVNTLVDEEDDGFHDGQGTFHFFGGLDLAKLDGMDKSETHGFIALRLQAVYRPAYAYEHFDLYGEPVAADAYGGAFAEPLAASSFEVYAGLRICYID